MWLGGGVDLDHQMFPECLERVGNLVASPAIEGRSGSMLSYNDAPKRH